MNLFYLDSSAWVKRYQRESGSDWLDTLWQRQAEFASSRLGFVEVAATVARRHGQQNVGRDLTSEVVGQVARDYEAFVRIDLDQAVAELASRFAATYRLRGADAAHLGSVVFLRKRSRDPIYLVASDLELLRAAQAEGFAVLDPQTNPPIPEVPGQ